MKMKVLTLLKFPLLVIITSFFLFPFEFTSLPGINTKMILAAFGLIVFCIRFAKTRSASCDKDFIIASVFAAIVSLIGLVAVVYNSTNDMTYASYIISFFVWMGAAFFVINCVKVLHGEVYPELIINYMIAVCVCQCIIAIMIDQFPLVKNAVDSFLAGEGFMGKANNRMYGIGAALDVAGEKFACALLAISFVVMKKKDISQLQVVVYWFCYSCIAIIGNIIGRTTTVGLIISIGFILCEIGIFKGIVNTNVFSDRIAPLLTIIIITLPLLIYSSSNNLEIRSQLRFGFEGFVSLVENGKWETNSNNRLSNMVKFPDNTKTWIIGDGYFNNPYSDKYYIGYNPTEYYKGTDIGYLRFIFYFGIVGMLAFAIYMSVVCYLCIRKHRQYSQLLRLLLLVNYLVWFKVSTDIFLLFALFLCVPANGDYEIKNEAWLVD